MRIAQTASITSGTVMTRGLSCGFWAETRFSEENIKHLARHVEGGEKCAEKTENERDF